MSEHYHGLACMYLRDSEEFVAKGDYVQASEKLWGATAEIVKTVARRGCGAQSSWGPLEVCG